MSGLAAFLLLQAGDSDPAELLRRAAARMRDAATLRAQLVQRRKTALLEEPVVSKGVLHWRRDPALLVIRLAEPHEARIHVDRAAYQVHRPSERRLERIEFGEDAPAAGLLRAFDPRPEELRKVFSIRSGTTRGDEAEVLLEPLDERLKRRLKVLALVFGAADAALRRLRYEEADGDEVSFELSALAANPEEPADLWELRVPEGTRVLVHRAGERR